MSGRRVYKTEGARDSSRSNRRIYANPSNDGGRCIWKSVEQQPSLPHWMAKVVADATPHSRRARDRTKTKLGHYHRLILRRRRPARPRMPVPNITSVPGSGVAGAARSNSAPQTTEK